MASWSLFLNRKRAAGRDENRDRSSGMIGLVANICKMAHRGNDRVIHTANAIEMLVAAKVSFEIGSVHGETARMVAAARDVDDAREFLIETLAELPGGDRLLDTP